jgi:hypothetical protein
MEHKENDLRNVILILVRACVYHKTNATTTDNLLSWIMALPPNQRAALTPATVQSKAKEIRDLVAPRAQKEAEQVGSILRGAGDFFHALQLYASMQHWD